MIDPIVGSASSQPSPAPRHVVGKSGSWAAEVKPAPLTQKFSQSPLPVTEVTSQLLRSWSKAVASRNLASDVRCESERQGVRAQVEVNTHMDSISVTELVFQLSMG